MNPYRAEIETAAAAHGLEADLLDALVMQESAGRTDAFRYEPAFWTRYLRDNPKYARRNPREVSSSYGLCQVMYPTAVDHGFTGHPWELFAPAVGLEYGARVLARLMAWADELAPAGGGDRRAVVTRAALAAYNGGRVGNAPSGPLRNARYADEVLARVRTLRNPQQQP